VIYVTNEKQITHMGYPNEAIGDFQAEIVLIVEGKKGKTDG